MEEIPSWVDAASKDGRDGLHLTRSMQRFLCYKQMVAKQQALLNGSAIYQMLKSCALPLQLVRF